MTTSTFFKANLLRILRGNGKYGIVMAILAFLGIPMITGAFAMAVYTSASTVPYESNPIAAIALGTVHTSIVAFTGFIAAILSFAECYSRTRVDYIHALPLTGRQRFWSEYLGGLLVYLAPMIVSMGIGLCLLLGIGAITDFEHTSITITQYQTVILYYYLPACLGLLLLMWLYYTLTVLVISCCGTLFECLGAILFGNAIIPAVHTAILLVISHTTDALPFASTWKSIGLTSPLGGLAYLLSFFCYTLPKYLGDTDSSFIGYTVTGSDENSWVLLPFLHWIVLVVLVTLFWLWISSRLFVARRAQHVGKPFVYLGLYHLLLTALTVLILCPLVLGEASVSLFVLALSATVYLVIEVIRKRGFARFFLTILAYAGTVIGTVLAYFAFSLGMSPGLEVYLPNTGSISNVTVNILVGELDMYLTYTDKEIIKEIRSLQAEYNEGSRGMDSLTETANRELALLGFWILDDSVPATLIDPQYYNPYDFSMSTYTDCNGYRNYYESLGYAEGEIPSYDGSSTTGDNWIYAYVDYYYAQISYQTKFGFSFTREYTLPCEEYLALLRILCDTEVYAQSIADYVEASVAYTQNRSSQITVYDSHDTICQDVSLSAEQYKTLAELYLAELENYASTLADSPTLATVRGLAIPVSFSQCCSLLKSYGFTDSPDPIVENPTITIFPSGQYACSGMLGSCNASYSGNRNACLSFVTNGCEDQKWLEELYEHIQCYGNGEMVYLVQINTKLFFLPEEYGYLVEDMIAPLDSIVNLCYNKE